MSNNNITPKATINDFNEYKHISTLPAIVVKDGKYGLAKSDGSGDLVEECKHERIQYFRLAGMFVVTDNGLMGLLSPSGSVVLPQIAEMFFEPVNDVIQYQAGGKFGLIDMKTGLVVDALYDEMGYGPKEEVTVTKEGVKGFLGYYDGRFISEEEAQDEDFDEFLLDWNWD